MWNFPSSSNLKILILILKPIVLLLSFSTFKTTVEIIFICNVFLRLVLLFHRYAKDNIVFFSNVFCSTWGHWWWWPDKSLSHLQVLTRYRNPSLMITSSSVSFFFLSRKITKALFLPFNFVKNQLPSFCRGEFPSYSTRGSWGISLQRIMRYFILLTLFFSDSSLRPPLCCIQHWCIRRTYLGTKF